MKKPILLSNLVLSFCLGPWVSGLFASELSVDPSASAQLRKQASELVKGAGESQVIEGKDGWLFFLPELRHLAAGTFWGEQAAGVSKASRPEWADPLPIIVEFSEQVKQAGGELIFVPVPPKAVIYPDKLPDGAPVDLSKRSDDSHAEFMGLLRSKGVNVVDLAPLFLAHRKAQGDGEAELLFCRTDTHWSPRGCEVAASAIFQAAKPHLPPPEPSQKFTAALEQLTFTGDLARMKSGDKAGTETLPGKVVIDATTKNAPVDDRESPLLLVGDSHLLVFHVGGDMHASGAGVAAHLAQEYGRAADVVGVRGSGASPSRISLLRRGDKLAGKKVVVWLLTSREFTETQGWRPVPVVSDVAP
jgi:alginate O-acetyltransferase complex protein AlgJ